MSAHQVIGDVAGSATQPRATVRRLVQRFEDRAGGPARRRVITLLACVLALNTADTSTVGAVASQLERSLHVGNTDIGLLVAVTAVVAALATVPVGMLTDRVTRVRLLGASVALWTLAMIASGASSSFEMLLVTRLALGAVTATAGPTLASLVGDYFPAGERARVYGLILSGELIGAAFGFVVSGDIGGALGWRSAFWFLSIPSLILSVAIFRMLPEPARGGASELHEGDEEIRSAEDVAENEGGSEDDVDAEAQIDELAKEAVQEEHVGPDPGLVLRRDPRRMSVWSAVRYVLRVRTNRVMIVASALGYFYITGLETFAVVYLRDRYDLAQAAATSLLAVMGIGALAGVVVSGRIADRMLRSGRAEARVVVPAVSFLLATALFIPALLSGSLVLAVLLYVIAVFGLSASNPPLDAARLDIMHPLLWGRAEAVRTLLRMGAVAGAPLLFGWVSEQLGSGGGGATTPGHTVSSGGAQGLEYTFLVMLVTLGLGGVILLRARHSYPRDVATAIASVEAVEAAEGRPDD